jgi:hypothetical protein
MLTGLIRPHSNTWRQPLDIEKIADLPSDGATFYTALGEKRHANADSSAEPAAIGIGLSIDWRHGPMPRQNEDFRQTSASHIVASDSLKRRIPYAVRSEWQYQRHRRWADRLT